MILDDKLGASKASIWSNTLVTKETFIEWKAISMALTTYLTCEMGWVPTSSYYTLFQPSLVKTIAFTQMNIEKHVNWLKFTVWTYKPINAFKECFSKTICVFFKKVPINPLT